MITDGRGGLLKGVGFESRRQVLRTPQWTRQGTGLDLRSLCQGEILVLLETWVLHL